MINSASSAIKTQNFVFPSSYNFLGKIHTHTGQEKKTQELEKKLYFFGCWWSNAFMFKVKNFFRSKIDFIRTYFWNTRSKLLFYEWKFAQKRPMSQISQPT